MEAGLNYEEESNIQNDKPIIGLYIKQRRIEIYRKGANLHIYDL
jgi:hypothetical protein